MHGCGIGTNSCGAQKIKPLWNGLGTQSLRESLPFATRTTTNVRHITSGALAVAKTLKVAHQILKARPSSKTTAIGVDETVELSGSSYTEGNAQNAWSDRLPKVDEAWLLAFVLVVGDEIRVARVVVLSPKIACGLVP